MSDPKPLKMLFWPDFMRFGLNRTEMYALARVYGLSYWVKDSGEPGGRGFCDITPQQLADETLGFISYRAFCRALRTLEDKGLIYGNRTYGRRTLWHVTRPSRLFIQTLVDDGYSEEDSMGITAEAARSRQRHKISNENRDTTNAARAGRLRKRAE